MIKASIIIAIYNKSQYLSECIQSALKQTMSSNEYEVILVDDGSTDGSTKIAEKYYKNNSNVKFIVQENRGISAAQNTGIRAAKGKYIHILQADDVIDENLLTICYDICEQYKLEILNFSFKKLYSTNKSLSNDLEEEVVFNTIFNKIITGKEIFINDVKLICVFAYFYNREFLIKNQLEFDETIFIDDEEFMPRMYMKAKRAMCIKEYLYKYRISEVNTTIQVKKQMKFFNTRQITLYKFLDVIEEYKDENIKLKYALGTYFLQEVCLMLEQIQTIVGINKDAFLKTILNDYMSKYLKIFGVIGTNIEISERALDIYEKIIKLLDNDKLSYKKNVCKELDMLFKNSEKMYNDKKIELLQRIPFNNSDKIIGIYGLGKHTEKMLEFYKNNIGKIEAKVIFIDSFKGENNEKFQQSDIINVKNVNDYKFDCFVISSAAFEEKLKNNLLKYLNKKINIYGFYDENKYLVYFK